ncbi:cobaltochelatase subunit CobN [Pseudomonas sp. TTU2014-080ASC]|uniref:cobaltochelatase subunit CobN n=1 Tax=Pseudomonas sp. TTU2014-080ASC TaxID=1729724 RepID=UPI0007183881|nr:cobaltochelatase subunit CobN [Pseudomonas sp. TTU2014-080ASC]KRW62122.1 cobalamin biosynthesis protein CobN [Pseudomonas sp. TTU2014-080ASC]
MRTLFLIMIWLFVASTVQADTQPDVRVLANDFVLPGKLQRLQSWASEAGMRLDSRNISRERELSDDLLSAGLLILDTPRPNDLAQMQAFLGERLKDARTPWIRVGGGAPAFGNLPPPMAYAMIGYYANGGEANLRQFLSYWKALKAGQDVSQMPPPKPLPATGMYHPDAPELFSDVNAYLAWGSKRWPEGAPRVGFVIHSGAIADAELGMLDGLIKLSEAHGQAPVLFWFDAQNPHGLTEIVKPANVQVLINLTHMQNAAARQAEFLDLNIPVLQTFGERSTDIQGWRESTSGIAMHAVAPLLGVPESWGMSDPLVISAVEKGEPVLIPEQAEALMRKVNRLVRLQTLPVGQKRLALLFWNHPDGEKNISASHLNVPRSLATLSARLAEAGYKVPVSNEAQLTETAQRLLGGYYRPETLDALLKDDLAVGVPLEAYQRWLGKLPESVRNELTARWGDPSKHWAIRTLSGKPQFIIPRAKLGSLTLMSQPPRAGRPGEAYHDSKVPPDHIYLAAYLLLHDLADALIHFGTHGTQEWLPGKDRGLSVNDYSFLAMADLPVFYPYIQDNIGEAIQARRRGRAVTVSHQTPPFAPAGLYDELRDLHDLIHQYQQLEEGAVQQQTAIKIIEFSQASGLLEDLQLDAATAKADFDTFFARLHDHLHALATDNLPLGLHTFGEPSRPEHRLSTVLQQLGEPYLKAVAEASGKVYEAEPVAMDFAELKKTEAYSLLDRYVLQAYSLDELPGAGLREQLEKARGYELNLARTGEIEALLAGLAGGFVAPGSGGDPVRNPQVPSGRNIYAFEADKLPTRAAYEAGEQALQQLIDSYKAEHEGQAPRKLAFSLWSSEAMRHFGILESQVLHAMGLRPVWDEGGRVRALAIIPRTELGRPRIDVVIQATSVYRDQFDGFMRLLAEAVERLEQLDEADNPIAANSKAVQGRLQEQGMAAEQAKRLASVRIFSNEPGDYGSGVTDLTLDSTQWEDESALAEQYLSRLGSGYGSRGLVPEAAGAKLFGEQLKGVEAAVLARSSTVNGLLSTDHPFEYLGGLSLVIRHLDGSSPALYIADLRTNTPRMEGAAQFLSNELRSRYLNPQWIGAMQKEGYAGTLELLNIVNNVWGWQAMDRSMVRADQWQALHQTYVMDQRNLGLNEWFEANNPSAQAQLVERMLEAIRKGYWDADEQTRKELTERWQELDEQGATSGTQPVTREFIEQSAAGFGLTGAAPAEADGDNAGAGETVSGQVLQEVTQESAAPTPQWQIWLGFALLSLCLLYGGWRQVRSQRV